MAKRNKNASTFAAARALLAGHRQAHTPDIAKCLKDTGKFSFTESTFASMSEYGVDWSALFALPQKQIMRTLQLINAINAGEYRSIDPSYACTLYALSQAPETGLTYDTLHELVTGMVRKEGAEGDRKGVSRQALAKVFGRVSVSTYNTKKSVAVGNNGIFQTLGITTGALRTVNRNVTIDKSHPLAVATVALIEKGTAAQIESLGTGDKGPTE